MRLHQTRLTLAYCLLSTIAVSCGLLAKPIPKGVAWLESRGWTVHQLDERFEISKPDCLNSDLADLVDPMGLLEGIELVLKDTKISGDGLAVLRDHPAVLVLDVEGQPITDGSLTAVTNWSKLEELNLSATEISDAGLSHLRGLESLETLKLASCKKLTGTGLANVPSTTLTYLDLSGTQVDDSGIARIGLPSNLDTIILEGTSITRATMERLKMFDNLQDVYVYGVPDLSSDDRAVLHDPDGGITVYEEPLPRSNKAPDD